MEFLEPPGRGLLSAGLFSNLFAVLLCLVLHLMFDCVEKVVGKLANIAITITLQKPTREHLLLASMSKRVITSLLTSLTRCLASG